MFIDARDSKRKLLEDELTNYYSVPLGYVAKYKFHIEKKDNLLLDLDTKD